MANLFDPPQIFDIPLSTGRDLFCEFIYEPLVVDGNGDPILMNGQPQYAEADYPAGATVVMIIESDPVVTSPATIDGSIATVLIDHAEIDGITKKFLWRLGITYTSGVDDVLSNGMVYRSDGKHS